MSVTVTHTFVSGISDGGDATLVRPSNWNAAHTVDATTLPGHEFDYVEFTSNVNVTGTSSGTANTIVTGSSVAYDGSTTVWVEFFAESADTPAGNNNLTFELWLDGSQLATFGQGVGPDAVNVFRWPVALRRRQTPSNGSHTYVVKAYVPTGTGVVRAGGGTAGAAIPGYICITRV